MKEGRALFYPVRRKLMVITVSYLAGVLLTPVCTIPAWLLFALCAPAILSALMCRRYRRSVLFCVAVCFFLMGNMLAGWRLGVRDKPTQPGVSISGTVSAIESDFRVYLTDVRVEDGQGLCRNVLVTLMCNQDETRKPVRVGQRICGTGRLFAQEEPRNPGGVNRRIQAICGGYELSGYILPGWTAQGEERFSLREWIRQIRLALLERIRWQFGERAPMFEAIMLGDKDAVDDRTLAAMRLTGTVHLLTVSGLHLSMIANALRSLLKRLPIGRKTSFALLSAALIFFTGLTGCAPGTIRACITAILREFAGLVGRRYEPLTALSAAALGMTLLCPVMALNASFQFSFFVVLGILLLSGGMTRFAQKRLGKGRLLRRLASAIALSLSAQLSAIPIQLLLYGYIPLLALPMNVISGFMMPYLMLGGWSALALGGMLLALGRWMSGILGGLMGCFEAGSVLFASIEGGIWRLPAPYAATVPLAALLMALLSDRIRVGRLRRPMALAVLLAMLVSYAPRFDGRSAYVQLDVGQGDAALVRQGAHAVLVDVGPADSYEMLRYLRHEGLQVEKIILSHLDEDHAGALATLLNSEVPIGGVVMGEDAQDQTATENVRQALALARKQDVRIETVQAGDIIAASMTSFDVLSPDASLEGSNERSLVLAFSLGECLFLTTGDLPADCEMKDPPNCDVLKVSHHGSRNATSRAFLERTTPELALISVGADNRFGHPTQRVLEDLSAVGARICRTDQNGCVTVYPSKDGIRVRSYVCER